MSHVRVVPACASDSEPESDDIVEQPVRRLKRKNALGGHGTVTIREPPRASRESRVEPQPGAIVGGGAVAEPPRVGGRVRPQGPQSRMWCATVYDRPDDGFAIASYLEGFVLPEGVDYACFGRETCPDTGRKHLQLFVYFTTKKRRVQMCRLLGIPHCHAEPCKGSATENQTYCKKEGDSAEFGDFSKCPAGRGQGGGANGAARALAVFRKTGKLRDVIRMGIDGEKDVSYQTIKLIQEHAKFACPRPVGTDAVRVYWMYGPTGTGKSRAASVLTGEAAVRPVSFKWWEGYDEDRACIIDDYRADWCKFHELLKFTDIYPFRVETKGGSRQFMCNTIIFTAPGSPTGVWRNRSDEDLEQLQRRIHGIYEFVPPEYVAQLGELLHSVPNLPNVRYFVRKGAVLDEAEIRTRMETPKDE
jgi:hypothetical protein